MFIRSIHVYCSFAFGLSFGRIHFNIQFNIECELNSICINIQNSSCRILLNRLHYVDNLDQKTQ